MAIDKIADPVAAARAYANSGAAAGKTGAGGGDDELSFSNLLGDTVRSTVDSMRKAESMQAKAIKGTASLTDVVDAVNQAEATFQAIVAVRDRVISAYQDVMRFPI